MPAAVARGITCVVCLCFAGAAVASAQGEGGEPLRKTDLVRLLAGGTLPSDELAALVRRNCLSFTPTSRDRADLRALGADSAVLREIDGCTRRAELASAPPPAATPPVRKAATPRTTTPRRAPRKPATDSARRVPGSGLGAVPGPPRVAPGAVHRPTLSVARTGFIQGVGQRGTVGSRAAPPLVFEVRDTMGVPVSGEAVALTAVNARLTVSHAVTDSNGRVQVDLVLGPQAGPTAVTATAGPIERRAILYAEPGPPAKLSVRCGAAAIDRKVVLAPGAPVALRVVAQDEFGNVVPLANLQAAVGDRGVARIAFVGSDSLGGVVSVQPRQAGTTSLVVVGSGQREDLSVTVQGVSVASPARCP